MIGRSEFTNCSFIYDAAYNRTRPTEQRNDTLPPGAHNVLTVVVANGNLLRESSNRQLRQLNHASGLDA